MEDVSETDQFELRRSSRAQVSQRIAAIDNYQARAIQFGRRIGEDSSQRKMKRTLDMRGAEFVRRQHVDDLRAGRQQPPDFAMNNLAYQLVVRRFGGRRADIGKRSQRRGDDCLAAARRDARRFDLIAALRVCL